MQVLQVVLVCVLDHRHNQVARGQRRGHAEVDVLVNQDAVSIHTGVDAWEISNRLDNGFCDERGERELLPKFLLEGLLAGVAPLHQIGHIGLHKRGDVGLVWTLRTMWSAIILRIRSISTMSWARPLVATGAALATGAGAGVGVGVEADVPQAQPGRAL